MKTKMGIRELAERAKAEGAYDLAQGVIDAAPPTVLMEALRGLPLGKISTYNNKRGVKVDFDQVMATAGANGGAASVP